MANKAAKEFKRRDFVASICNRISGLFRKKKKKNPTSIPIRASAEISIMEIRRLAPQTVHHLCFPTTWQAQNIVSL